MTLITPSPATRSVIVICPVSKRPTSVPRPFTVMMPLAFWTTRHPSDVVVRPASTVAGTATAASTTPRRASFRIPGKYRRGRCATLERLVRKVLAVVRHVARPQALVAKAVAALDQLALGLVGPRLRLSKAGFERHRSGGSGDGDPRDDSVVSEGELRRREAAIDAFREVFEAFVPEPRYDVAAQRGELLHGLLPPVGDQLLDRRVADDRNSRQAREDVDDVGGLPAALPLDRSLEFPVEEPCRRKAGVAPEPPGNAGH